MKQITEHKTGHIEWQSPSNIAIVKYWGKHGNQLPANPSLSFTLSTSYSQTSMEFDVNPDRKKFDLDFEFEGKPSPKFAERIQKYFERNAADFPYLNNLKLYLKSRNSFPHSAGIASSASAMSALAMCIASMESRLFGGFPEKSMFRMRASHLARLASGSAARSVYGGLVAWGESEFIANSSDYYAVPVNENLHDTFKSFHDTILIVDAGEKAVSSSAGHSLMTKHPYSEMRYFTARQHMEMLKEIMEQGDVEEFGKILENEALTLHGLMMNSDPSFILMKPNTLKIIEIVREVRESQKFPWYFTLDAGPNVHLMYPHEVADEARKLITELLVPYTQGGQVLYDQVGAGPRKIQGE
ncbi:MAG: diphosphomevalonate decarboxylase [Bacteroidetes bacterium]|nr:diphosphomevalonate decarboxylase [Bacteroidota bacterium]